MRARTIIAVFTTIAVLAAAGAILGLHLMHSGLRVAPRSSFCTAQAGGEVTLDLEQMANAATITAVGIRIGMPERAVTVALATSLQESKLVNLSGGDRDSIGLFQQRPSQGWGTPEQIADPRYASKKFYTALQRVSGWQKMTITQAAQAVQRSARPDAYQQWADEATVLSRALLGDASHAVACNVSGTPSNRGATAIGVLSDDLSKDWGSLVREITDSDPDALALSVADGRTGWQYAHWLVAHAQDSGIATVRYADQEWTARGGIWAPAAVTDGGSEAATVVAEVYSGR